MAAGIFITTEKLPQYGLNAERLCWEALQQRFADEVCLAYWRYPLFSHVGMHRKEPDILLLHPQYGVVVIEVKALTIDQIVGIDGHLWRYQHFYRDSGNPYEQAEAHLFAFLAMSDREPSLRRKIHGQALVALPNITRSQWQKKSFDQHPCCPPILFKDDIAGGLVNHHFTKRRQLNDSQWHKLCAVAGNTSVLQTTVQTAPLLAVTKADSIAQAQQQLIQFDQQQEQLAKQIPDGPQRIRGIAGSGKTVMLCQKAAHMHVKHSDWDIALVFFTRSLYEPIIAMIDGYVRQFTQGTQHYQPQTSRLRVLHAWGAKQQAGLYTEICHAVPVQPLTPAHFEQGSPIEKLCQAITQLQQYLAQQHRAIAPLFDAVLLDEGQDLVVESAYKIQGLQPFYWMAYQACKPIIIPQTADLFEGVANVPSLRRLIWAYDEAQSLNHLAVPSSREVFGEAQAHLLQGQYDGGVRKSMVIQRCYRTPSPILTAAHALGMGLFREDGMLSGVTTQKDWLDLGYRVSGTFKPNQSIYLYRPKANSPNPMPALSGHPLLECKLYTSRYEEAEAVANKVAYDIESHRLTPHQQLLIVSLHPECDQAVMRALRRRNINFYIPAAKAINSIDSAWPQGQPNQFWHDNAVTISRIHRAKGHEADMVYVVGLDSIAAKEDSVIVRNQLFVAMTRSKGWLHLSGLNQSYPFYDELKQVLAANGSYQFIYKKAPQRDVSEASQTVD